ncbi:MAG: gamma-glutamyl-gamma-aminobutyrate hydrolase family protein, partial [Rhodospirillales bacterium]
MIRAALTTRITEAAAYDEPRDSISHDWIVSLESWNVMPVLVPNRLSDPCAYFDTLQADILILTGGDNIGETPERDETELKLIDHTLIVGKPILGI